jgi:hypothetical protein
MKFSDVSEELSAYIFSDKSVLKARELILWKREENKKLL